MEGAGEVTLPEHRAGGGCVLLARGLRRVRSGDRGARRERARGAPYGPGRGTPPGRRNGPRAQCLSGPVAELLELDRRHVWHPYGPMPGRREPLVVESASGVRLRLADGSGELVDGMSSWWSAIHGYNHPVLNEAARGQLERMSHVMFGGLTHEPAVRLAKLLVDVSRTVSSTCSSPTPGRCRSRSR
ncbi:hypothetical protein GCM10023238_23760 [Streptomyces heliomycini]